MPFKTKYGSHYHVTEGCHGATIPCGTEGLSPCSDCCGNAGSGLGGGSALGAPSVTESGGRLAYEELGTFATDGVDITLSAGTLAKVEEDGDLESYLAMAACASTEVYIDDMREVGRNPDGSVTFHVRGEYMGTEDDYREIDDDRDEPPMVGTIQASGAVMEMGSSGLRSGMDTPIGTIDATDLQGMATGSAWHGDGTHRIDTGFVGETHEVAGCQVPVGMTEEDLTVIGSRPILDEYGEDPTGGEGIDPLPVGEVAAFVEYATRHNNDNGPVISDEALRRTIDAERLVRADNIDIARGALRQMEEQIASDRIPVAQRMLMERRANMLRRQIAQPEDWSLWAVSTGEDLALVAGRDAHGHGVMVIDGTSYALTGEFASQIGTIDASVPMWDVMVELEGWNPYDYADFIQEMTYDILLADGKIYDLDGPGQ